ncbi:MAG: NAD(P)-dependent oxidoreductase [Negativicutes bacterium]|nr:NAD(P)-dependent oxidoreductase [Negativicutes bacterium]
MKKVGFIGLGTMGLPMVKNLLKAGFELTVFNRTKDRTKGLEALGAKVVDSAAEVPRQGCQVIFTMLTADKAVEEVYFGSKGLLEGVSAGQIVVDASTISPLTSKKVATELGKLGVEVLDAPVTGSEPQAIEGKIFFICGGKQEVYEKCLPMFDAMGKGSIFMGGNGAGSYTKLANNMMAAINLVGYIEAAIFAQRAGIDPQKFVDVVSNGGARSGQCDMKAPKILGGDFHPNFAGALMYKDLGLAGEVAKEANIPLPALALVKELLQMTIAKGFGKEDVCAIARIYEDWAHTEVRK